MKTILTFLAAFLAVAIPVSLSIELIGFRLPVGADFLGVFCAFVATFVTLIALSDYSHPRRVRSVAVVSPVAQTPKAAHPLAA